MLGFLKDKDNKPSKAAKTTLVVIAAVIVGLLVFRAGLLVGYRKARFSYGLGDRYDRNFVGPRGGMMGGFRGDGYFGAHGVTGRVLGIEGGTLLVEDRDGSEKTVTIDANTAIRLYRDTVTPEEIQPDDYVTVIGEPDATGDVVAKFIRIMPEPPTGGWMMR